MINLKRTVKVKFTKGDFTCAPLGNVYEGRVAEVSKKHADHFISMGYAVLVDDAEKKPADEETGKGQPHEDKNYDDDNEGGSDLHRPDPDEAAPAVNEGRRKGRKGR